MIYIIISLKIIFVLHNSTHERCDKYTKAVSSWCQAKFSKSKCQIEMLPLSFPSITDLTKVWYPALTFQIIWTQIEPVMGDWIILSKVRGLFFYNLVNFMLIQSLNPEKCI